MQSQCTSCSLFTRRSLHHEEQYQSSVLCERLRTSNAPPTDAEFSHVRHTILPTVSGDILAIDSKIASLHEVIRSMEEERGRLIEVQAKYNNLVSLHRTLPLEIWSKIFLYTISTPQDANAFNASGIIWGLSHVCHRWRSIALSLQSFWSTMDLHFPQDAQSEGDVQRLEVVIQRSGQGLLNVSLSDGIPSNRRYRLDSDLSIPKRMLDIMVAETYRWREFHLTAYEKSLHTMLYAALPNRLPRLEAVGLYFAPLEQHTAVSVFKDCPRLTKLILGTGTLGFEFPWDQITEVDLSNMTFHGDEEKSRACMRLIGQCPLLEILSTPESGPYRNDDDESASTPITCLHMSKLDTSSAHVIDVLTIPRLREASLNQDRTYPFPDMLYSFERLLRRSNCITALTRLSLTSVPLSKASSETHLLSILTQTHSLTFLDFAVSMQGLDGKMNNEELVAIVNDLDFLPKEAVTFLPLLSSLGIRLYDLDDAKNLRDCMSVSSFVSMVEARWKGDKTQVGLARLRTCHLAASAGCMTHDAYWDNRRSVTFDVFTEAESRMFTALVEEGMDLSIQITAKSTVKRGGDKVVFAISKCQ